MPKQLPIRFASTLYDLIDAASEAVPHIGIEELLSVDILDLRQHAGYVVRRERVRAPEWFPGGELRHTTLHLPRGRDEMLNRLDELTFYAWKISPPAVKWSRRMHRAFALRALFPIRRSRTETKGVLARLSAAIGDVGEAHSVIRLAAAIEKSLSTTDVAARYLRAAAAARNDSNYRRAAEWYGIAETVARARCDAEAARSALLGAGRALWLQGLRTAAGESLNRVLIECRRAADHTRAGHAWHTLMCIAIEDRDHARVRECARMALSAHGQGYDAAASLAADLACFWMEEGQFSEALPVLLTLHRAGLSSDRARCAIVVNLALAAAYTGDVQLFQRALRDFAAEDHDQEEGCVIIYSEMARACGIAGSSEIAVSYARRARDIALESDDTINLARAEGVLARLEVVGVGPLWPVAAASSPADLDLSTEVVQALTA